MCCLCAALCSVHINTNSNRIDIGFMYSVTNLHARTCCEMQLQQAVCYCVKCVYK